MALVFVRTFLIFFPRCFLLSKQNKKKNLLFYENFNYIFTIEIYNNIFKIK